ncbi:tyrosine-protein phosphatase non-receptor type 61F isoform X1 [Diorhabda carinulata]|uniref:tyrosine-protein phosphatase non-receptor type 61F isoform X1 n=1 Tax=Diorhabda sublineata TaxID=1163346 RepID=UPI0024E14DDD|nr:tyrosine-protein phosphatase non-receptor type 61F isoform X1 [Diorhabda sublineata]XP_057671594.1 tyrosine-protein phosphatase non-receptor type 61F isoform X1 [Diorhabda carinulata]
MTSGNNIESEYLQLNAKNEWQILYQRIRNQSYKDNIYTEAVKPQNKILNRYRDVNPYDHSRIVLNRNSIDYINANLVKVERANRQYILTQGPLSNTYSHFWLMIWEQQTKAVVMLNKLVEKKQDKCYQYWPSKIGSEHIMKLEDVGLTVEYLEQQDHSYYLTRLLRLTDTESGKSRDIIQFHYTTWPDFGVPCSPTAFLEFLKKVRDAGGLEADVGPAVVHCSAGIGRSGTFCLVDSCLVLIEKYGINSVDVKEILLEMRKYRMGLIQTAEQLRFSYQAIIEGTKQIFNQNSDDNKDNHVVISNNISPNVSEENSESEDEPPPLPPPRMESLNKTNGNGIDRPLPLIPKSISEDNGWNFENKEYQDEELQSYIPSGPLPVVPGDELSEEDELEEEDDDDEEVRSESPVSDHSDLINSKQSSELRQRNRLERKEKLEAQVRDMKRRQQANEQWTQLKRSLYLPLVIGGTLILGGGLIAYFYFKD